MSNSERGLWWLIVVINAAMILHIVNGRIHLKESDVRGICRGVIEEQRQLDRLR